MPDGRVWEDYQKDPLAGICQEPEVKKRAAQAFGIHHWGECPMSAAFGWKRHLDIPSDKKIAVYCFIVVYDALLLKHL
jgi:hypothetical protein